MKRTNYYYPEQLLERCKQAKKLLGISIAEFIRQAIDAALKRMKL